MEPLSRFDPFSGKALPEYAAYSLREADWRDGLLVRSPNWLGDAVMALPALQVLSALKPKYCGVFVVCPNYLAPFYEAIPWVSNVFPAGSGHAAWSGRLIRRVTGSRPGVGFLFLNSLRSAYYFRRCLVPKLFGASKGLRDLLLTRAFAARWRSTPGHYADIHQSAYYLAMAKALGAADWDRTFPDFQLPEDWETVPPAVSRAFRSEKQILAVAPGAAYGPAKRWPPERYRRLCDWWIRERDGAVFVLGGVADRETAATTMEGLPADRAFNLAGATSLTDLMAALRRSAACVSNDSGVMHLAAALGVRGAAIFGSTDPYATGPLGGQWVILSKRPACAPCFSRRCVNPKQDYCCLGDIAEQDVASAVDFILR